MKALHSCDNRPCCNPAHLREGTQQENLQEAHAKGRMVDNNGVNSSKAKLTEDAVREIRQVFKPMCRRNGARALAKRYGVSHTIINRVVNDRSYRNVA